MGEVTVIVAPAPFEAAAKVLVERLSKGARLAIPGGSAMATVKAARQLAAPALWRSLRLTWVDERLVPQGSLASNRGEAYRLGVLTADQRPAVELPLVNDEESASSAIERATHGLSHDFDAGLDVALLGLGEDGHVASLFPQRAPWADAGLVSAISDAPKPPPQRLTLTVRALGGPETFRLVVASGAGKREALQRVVDLDPLLPTTALGDVTVVTDLTLRRTQVRA